MSGGGPAAAPRSNPDRAAAAILRQQLDAAVSSEDRRLRRLVQANTSVHFLIGPDESDSVTLRLDGAAPAVIAGEPAEITIQLDADQAHTFAVGQFSLPGHVHAGNVAYRGPVRKYLTVHAVLEGLLADLIRP